MGPFFFTNFITYRWFKDMYYTYSRTIQFAISPTLLDEFSTCAWVHAVVERDRASQVPWKLYPNPLLLKQIKIETKSRRFACFLLLLLLLPNSPPLLLRRRSLPRRDGELLSHSRGERGAEIRPGL
uniref:Uncharacterized protein n=1 Tax=Oryza brachyantha TaxID=4533 RepID=J3N0S6_ORYBR